MKRFFSLLLVSCCVLMVSAQDMKTLFINMPDSVAPLLTKVNREDCVDFLEYHMQAKVKNKLGKTSQLDTLTTDYLNLKMTASCSLEMKLLPVTDSTQVICLVKTVDLPVADSHVSFFDTQWTPLDAEDFLKCPLADDFYQPVDSLSEEDVALRAKADIDLMKAKLSIKDRSLTFTYTTPQYLTKEDQKKFMKQIRREALVYEWKDGRFVLK